MGGAGPWAGTQLFLGCREPGVEDSPPLFPAQQLSLSPDHSPDPLLPLLPTTPHLTPDYLIKGKNLGAINDLLFLLLLPLAPLSTPPSALPAWTQITVSQGGTRLSQRRKGLLHQLLHFTAEQAEAQRG